MGAMPSIYICVRIDEHIDTMHMEKTLGLRKGTWTHEEDKLLRACIQKYGEGKWHLVPQRAGLNRCRKSCRLRWLNYLNPNINRGNFTEDEVDMILRFHKLLGNRWSLIAGRLPGRTANDVKNYWHTNLRSKVDSKKEEMKVKEKPEETMKTHVVIKPRPRTFSKHSPWLRGEHIFANDGCARECATRLVAANDDSGPRECTTTTPPSPVFTIDNDSRECTTQTMFPIDGGVGVRDCGTQACLANVPQSAEWWESLLNLDDQVGDEGNGTYSLNGQEENSFLDFSNVEDFFTRGQRGWSDCCWDSNL